MRTVGQRLWRNTDGAVAPVVALSLVALIAAGGIGFDYARLVSLDSELQDAADQAALAAAGQLDGQTGACDRARAAAASLVSNTTLFANETASRAITVTQGVGCDSTADDKIHFYQSYDQLTDTPGPAATTDANAKVVIVSVDTRRANYALTPIVAAVSTGDIGAEAVASLGSAICKVPPVMVCNPAEPAGNTNVNYPFNPASLAGKGLKLVSVGNSGSTAWAPGDFGYLNTGSDTSNPNVELRQALGWTGAPGDCSPLTGVMTRTGAGTPVTQALNTRFDIYEKANTGNGNAASCPSGGSCPPSINTVKDLVRKDNPPNGGKCGITNNEWELPAKPYLPISATDLDLSDPTKVPSAMGYPRDECHAVSNVGVCSSGKIGDGVWDRNAYFYVNYGWTAAQWPTFLSTGAASARIPVGTSPTRYQVYLWEIANRNTVIGGKTILGTRAFGSPPNTGKDYDSPVCSPLQTPATSGIVPGGSNVDRRRISAAVVNCTASNVHGGGNTVYPVAKWIEMFLVEPSVTRSPPGGGGNYTDQNDVYVEVIGETISGGAGATAAQVVRHDVPYLIK
jgi:Flp pilus assembly protein TadG